MEIKKMLRLSFLGFVISAMLLGLENSSADGRAPVQEKIDGQQLKLEKVELPKVIAGDAVAAIEIAISDFKKDCSASGTDSFNLAEYVILLKEGSNQNTILVTIRPRRIEGATYFGGGKIYEIELLSNKILSVEGQM